MPTWPQTKNGTHIFPHVSWEWPSSSSSVACSANTSVGNNAPGGLVTRSVPHAFLPAYHRMSTKLSQ